MLGKLIRPLICRATAEIRTIEKHALQDQLKTFKHLIKVGAKTRYGKKLSLNRINSYEAYRELVPLSTYEDLLPWIELIKLGERDVLWKGKPLYFAKTSGTTARVKYIPLSRDGLRNQIRAARQLVFNAICRTSLYDTIFGKWLFLSGSPEVEYVGKIPAGRLSGIAHRHVPAWLLKNRLPSWSINAISDWEEKLKKIIEEVLQVSHRLKLLSGIPPWIIMFFEWVEEFTGKHPAEIFPNLRIYIHGGVQFTPYEERLRYYMPKTVFIETFPASEGFFAFQVDPETRDMLLLTRHGIFYEFIPFEEINKDQPTRLWLGEVETGKRYELVVTTDSGLWSYRMGDIVEFVSVNPFRIKVVGRSKLTLSPFGEHVIIEEIEEALKYATDKLKLKVKEFCVSARIVAQDNHDKPAHLWFIELESDNPTHTQLNKLSKLIDTKLQELNPYYKDLRNGNIIKEPEIFILKPNGFRRILKKIGKLGEQHKVPRVDPSGRLLAQLMKEISYPSV